MTCLLDWRKPSAGRVHFGSLARAFRDAGHDLVGVIPEHPGGQPFSRVARVPLTGESLGGQTLLSVRHLRLLLAALRDEQPDVLYYRFRSCAPAVVSAVRRFSPRTCVVTEFNNLPSDLLLMSGYNRPLAALARHGQLRSARGSHLIRTLSDTHRDYLVAAGLDAGRIVVAGTGADLHHFRPDDRVASCVRAGLDPSLRYVTFVGHLTRWQGVDVLVRAAPSVCAARPDVRFVIAGTGPQLDRLRALAASTGVADRVFFAGEVAYERVPDIINASDVCIGPLVAERSGQMTRSPMKLREYAACARVSVTVDVAGAQPLQNVGAAVTVPSGDHAAVGRAISRALEQDAWRAQAGAAAAAYAQTHCGWNTIASVILARMEKLAP